MAKCRHFTLIFVSGFLFSAKAKAYSEGIGEIRLEAESGGVHLSSPSQSASVTFGQEQYLNHGQPAFRPGAERSDTNLTLRIQGDKRLAPGLHFKFDGGDEYSSGESANYVDIYNLDVEYRFHGGFTLALGRKLETWSAWDDRWGQGFFQARYLENRLRPKIGGLTGLFAGFDEGGSHFTLAALPIFIPDFGPQFQVQDGRFISANPWFNPPASQFVYRGTANQIRYALNAPSTGEIIGHPGAAAKWEYKDENYLSRVSLAVKPMAPFAQGFPSGHPLVVSASGEYVNIEITPRVVYASVADVDQEFRLGENVAASFSVAYEDPFNDSTPADFTAQRETPATIYSGVLRGQGEFGLPVEAELGFLKIAGADSGDRGPFAGSNTLFDRRYQFYEAYSLSLGTHVRALQRRLSARVRVIYDRVQNGGVVSVGSNYAFAKDWLASVDMDLMGLLSGEATMPDGFLAAYRADSRLGLGVSYVF